jgi:hypothetical protein
MGVPFGLERVRIAPMRPSIMSDGPRMSAPASAWASAIFTSASTVRSLTISPSTT